MAKLSVTYIEPTPVVNRLRQQIIDALKPSENDAETADVLCALFMTAINVLQNAGVSDEFQAKMAQEPFGDIVGMFMRQAGCVKIQKN